MGTTTATSTANQSQSLTISLEPHLVTTLRPLTSLLPDELALQLRDFLARINPETEQEKSTSHVFPTVPYDLLHKISIWTRSDVGKAALESHNPPLDPHSYSMIALLAGTRTSPERKFPLSLSASQDQEAEAKREKSDRRAVTALLNALLSILGSGFATWWAAERLFWKDEWVSPYLYSIAEGVLYLIWESRRSKSREGAPRRLRRVRPPSLAESKKDDSPTEQDSVELTSVGGTTYKSNLQLHQDSTGLREHYGSTFRVRLSWKIRLWGLNKLNFEDMKLRHICLLH
ncbi:hypothetical protein ABKN59_009231 [Abortiporus biennis]